MKANIQKEKDLEYFQSLRVRCKTRGLWEDVRCMEYC